jgi:hypothetical protein
MSEDTSNSEDTAKLPSTVDTGCIPYYFKKKYSEIILKLIHVI